MTNITVKIDGSDYTVWIADRKNYRFIPIQPDGQCDVSRIWGQRGKPLESFQGLDAPLHFIIEPDGSFIVTEKIHPYVKKFRPDGTFESVVAGDRAFNWSKSDRLFVASFEGKVYILSPNTNNILQFSPKP